MIEHTEYGIVNNIIRAYQKYCKGINVKLIYYEKDNVQAVMTNDYNYLEIRPQFLIDLCKYFETDNIVLTFFKEEKILHIKVTPSVTRKWESL